MSQVAARAGVSQATASSVLGGQANGLNISLQTHERVLSVARELGYQRNQLARAMITGKSRILGVLISPDIPHRVHCGSEHFVSNGHAWLPAAVAARCPAAYFENASPQATRHQTKRLRLIKATTRNFRRY